MSRTMIALCVTAAFGFAAPFAAQAASTNAGAAPLSKDAYASARKDAEAQYKVDKDACALQSANARDICVAQARGKEKAAKADALASYENTPKHRESALVAHSQWGYDVSMQKCDDLAGNPKDVCVKEAKAALVKGKADAKVDRVVADTRVDANTKRTEARIEASTDKRDADFKVAIEKCDALAGSAKDTCVGNAKGQFGKS